MDGRKPYELTANCALTRPFITDGSASGAADFVRTIIAKSSVITLDILAADNYKLWFLLVRGSDEFNAVIEKYAKHYPELLNVVEETTWYTALHCVVASAAFGVEVKEWDVMNDNEATLCEAQTGSVSMVLPVLIDIYFSSISLVILHNGRCSYTSI